MLDSQMFCGTFTDPGTYILEEQGGEEPNMDIFVFIIVGAALCYAFDGGCCCWRD